MAEVVNLKQENERPVFPFTAIIGQEEMKLALILNVIDPRTVSYTHLRAHET